MARSTPAGIRYPEDLPISRRRAEIADAISANPVVIVAGETGSGKTTQLPKICLELGRGLDKMIGHTQPRRLAARTVADRIAEELGVEVGGVVGYSVRFTDRVGPDTMVKLMTDGILLAELRRDRTLSAYDTIIVDEAHERSLNIDFILGYLARLLPRRPDLKVIVTSATIETERFSDHFGGAPVIRVTGRTYPVEVRYRPIPDDSDQIGAVVDAVAELGREPPGDVLVFLSGEREIHDTADALRALDAADTEILPLYARLSAAQQHRVFAGHPGRRIVLATNIAETSLTVPGVRYVIDAGNARMSRYSTRLKVQRLPIEAVSQASANQRAGRCGRVADGICIRLYYPDDFAARPEYTEPEILRTSLASVILAMADIGLGDIAAFPFIDPPDQRAVDDGFRLLFELGALGAPARGNGRDRAELTPIGRRLARLAIEPRFGRMVLEAERLGCLREVLIIASGLSIQDPRERPKDHATEADRLHARFSDESSDFLAYLKLWGYVRDRQRELSSSQFRRMCRREHLNFLRLREWQDVHSQLRRAVGNLGMARNTERGLPEVVHRALLAGLLSHIGHKLPESRDYLGARNARFTLFPGSAVARRRPEWVMVAELVETSRLWGRTAARIQPEWIEPIAQHLVKASHGEPHWSTRRGAAMVGERVTLYGLPIVVDRVVGYHNVDPDRAREMFIRHALVGGEWAAPHRFIEQNLSLLADLEELEHRFRRSDLVADADALEALYDQLIPTDVVSGHHFDAWWSAARRTEPGLLTFTPEDLLGGGIDELDEDAFPARWYQGGLVLGLSYAFEPGSPDDGVAVHIPITVLNQVETTGFDWQVPGLRTELVGELIRSLPKPLRRGLVPIPGAARAFLDRAESTGVALRRPLVEALADELTLMGGTPVGVGDFDLDRLPSHLRLRFMVIDDDDAVLASGHDLLALKVDLAGQIREAIAGIGAGLEQHGLTRWPSTDLPRVVERAHRAQMLRAYPALVDEGETVAVRLLETEADQEREMWAGTRRLLRLTIPLSFRAVLSSVVGAERLVLATSPYPNTVALLEDVVVAALDRLMVAAGGPAWNAPDFGRLSGEVRSGLEADVTRLVVGVADLLRARREVEARLGHVGAGPIAAAVADVTARRDALVYDGFVSAIGAGRIADVARYLRAMAMRLDHLRDDPRGDARRMAIVHRLEVGYEALFDDLAPGDEPGDDMIAVAWMLEELRVSLFAQALGTPGPVSEKRVQGAIDAVRRRRSGAAGPGPALVGGARLRERAGP